MLFRISGSRVSSLTARQQLSRNALATKAEIDTKTASKILRSGPAGTNVRPSVAEAVAKALRVGLEELRARSPELEARRAALRHLAEQVSCGDVSSGLESAFLEPHFAQWRPELLRFEERYTKAQVAALRGGSSNLVAIRGEFKEWALERVEELCACDDELLSSSYGLVCRHNLPTTKLLALKLELVDDCARCLSSGRSSTLALVAPHGRGKSSLALQLGRRLAHLCQYDAVVWVDLRPGATWKRVLSSFQELRVGYAPTSASQQDQVVELLAALYGSNDRVLFVLDNFDAVPDNALETFIQADSPCKSILITTTARDVITALNRDQCVIQEPALTWSPREFLSLLLFYASRRDSLAPLVQGAQVADDLLGAGWDEYDIEARPPEDLALQDRHLALNTLDFCRNALRYNPKMLTASLPVLEHVRWIDQLPQLPDEALQDMVTASEVRWNRLTSNAKHVAHLLANHSEGITEDLIATESGLPVNVCSLALDELKLAGFVDEQLLALDRDSMYRLHDIDLQVISRMSERPTGQTAAEAVRVLTRVRELGASRRSLGFARTFVQAIDTLRKSDCNAAAEHVLQATPALKALGLWQAGWECGEQCYDEARHHGESHLLLRLGVDLLSWISFWRGDHPRTLSILDECAKLEPDLKDMLKIELRRAHCMLHIGSSSVARRILDELRTWDELERDVSLRVDLLQVCAQLELSECQFSEAIHLAEQARRTAHAIECPQNRLKEQIVALYYRAEAERLAGDPEAAWETIWLAHAVNARQHVPSTAYENLCMTRCDKMRGFHKSIEFHRGILREARDIFSRLADVPHLQEVNALLQAIT